MNQDPSHPGPRTPDELPDALDADLRALYGSSVETPSRVDDAVMAAARQRFSEINAGAGAASGLTVVIRRMALVGGPLAAAAVLALVVWMTPWRPGQPQGPLPLPGTGRQQAQNMLEERVSKEMVGDELAFEQSRGEPEGLGFADARDDDVAGAGVALAEVAAADSVSDMEEFGRRRALASQPVSKSSAPPMREDFDDDGVVDMRDALALAMTLEKGEWTLGMEWDLNSDGRVDTDDVEIVAFAAVNLERHGEVTQ